VLGTSNFPLGVAVGERLPGMIGGERIAKQLLEVATGQPQMRGPLAA
jgi:hypothetical protein